MNVLGIETSCDDTAVAVLAGDRDVLSSIVSSQQDLHARFGGVVPELASRSHLETLPHLVSAALEEAHLDLLGVHGLAVTIGPGLIGSLLVGVQFAKGLALGTGLPIVGVNHLEAHVTAVFLDRGREPPEYPFIALVVSGGHSSIFLVDGPGRMKPLGRTLDDAAGEAFDKAAALLGLPYPGGPSIEKAALGGDPSAIAFPRAMLDRDSLDMSFSGLKSALRRHVERSGGAVPPEDVGHVAASFQDAVVDVLCRKTARAVERTGVGHVVLAGGVAANRALRARMSDLAHDMGFREHAVPVELCTDNGAMVASLGHEYLFGALSGASAPRGLDMDPFARSVAGGYGW